MPYVQFDNVSVTCHAGRSAREAYDAMCAALSAAGFDFTTDDFTVRDDTAVLESGDTSELWPADEPPGTAEVPS